MKPRCLIYLSLFVLCSCKNDKKDISIWIENKSDLNNRIESSTYQQSDSTCYTNTVRNLLKWYKINYETINSIQTVDMTTTNQKGRYIVNFDSVRKYLAVLRSSKLFTEEYLKEEYKYFQKCEKKYTVSKQNDGPPEMLEWDLILFTQEPDAVLNKYDTLKLTFIQSEIRNRKIVKLQSVQNNLIFDIVSISGGCLIQGIKSESKD